MTTAKAEPVHYTDRTAKYSFLATVIDLRNGERVHVTVDANTKASAGKKLRAMGYTVQDMGWV